MDLAIPTLGYKCHISIDRQNGIIPSRDLASGKTLQGGGRQIITDAAQHDGARLREGLIQTANMAYNMGRLRWLLSRGSPA